jgi:tetratricopeptide (TPR) repeat protein
MEKALGPYHTSTLDIVNNLGFLYRKQGKLNKAENMDRRTLERRERMLGKEHLDTLMSMSNLAGVLCRQGKYEEAEEMNRRMLELSKGRTIQPH